MEDLDSSESISLVNASDGLALGVASRVASRCGNHSGRRVSLLELNVASLGDISLSAGKHDLVQIRVEQHEHCLGLRVSESAVVLEHLGSVGGDHDTGVQQTLERKSFRTSALDGTLHNILAHKGLKLLCEDWCRAVCSHASSIGALVSIEDTLVVLRSRHENYALAVRKGKNRDLGTVHELFNDNLSAGLLTKLLIDHDGLEGIDSLLGGVRKNNTLASSKARGLDDDLVLGGHLAHVV
mmetsp:Transcript_17532/g.34475  ORF Transcript_17532/g.34475 Transcript_17532/m.34475 type:complete len:240 (-) Transcript_17532:473-1192(-)